MFSTFIHTGVPRYEDLPILVTHRVNNGKQQQVFRNSSVQLNSLNSLRHSNVSSKARKMQGSSLRLSDLRGANWFPLTSVCQRPCQWFKITCSLEGILLLRETQLPLSTSVSQAASFLRPPAEACVKVCFDGHFYELCSGKGWRVHECGHSYELCAHACVCAGRLCHVFP